MFPSSFEDDAEADDSSAGDMTPTRYTSAATSERIPSPTTHSFNPLYAAEAEERKRIVEEEELAVRELQELKRHFSLEYMRITNGFHQAWTRFNAMAYISRLPAEILSMIFDAYVVDHWTSNYPLKNPARGSTKSKATPYQWIKSVLHVCRQWRCVALSTPQLWTCITHDKIHQTWRLKFLLDHSISLPLTWRNDGKLAANDDDWKLYNSDTAGWVFLAQSFARVETLALTVTLDTEQSLTNLTKAGEAKEAVDAPSMRHVILDFVDGYRRNHSSLFSNVNMPHLKSLTVVQGPLDLVRRLSCSSLTRLDVSFSVDVLPNEFVDVVKGTPGLRQLLVRGLIPERHPTPQRRAVPLPSLEYLCISRSTPAAGQLLNRLVFPRNTLIELRANNQFPASLLSPLMPVVSGHTDCRPHTIRAEYDAADSRYMVTSVQFQRMTSQDSPHDICGSPTRAARTPNPSRDYCDGPRLNLSSYPAPTYHLDVLDTTEVVSLHLCPPPRWSESSAKELFRRPAFLKLETLHLEDGEAFENGKALKHVEALSKRVLEALIAAATPAVLTTDNDGLPSVQAPSTYLPLPSLKTFVLHNAYIGTNKAEDFKSPDDIALFSLLQRCAQSGYKFQLLKIADIDLHRCAPAITAAAIQDAVFKLGIADVVEVTSRSPALKLELPTSNLSPEPHPPHFRPLHTIPRRRAFHV